MVQQPLHPTTLTLLTIPTEIKLIIISFLSYDCAPNLAVLRRTHSSFLSIIPKSDLRTKCDIDTLYERLVYAEIHYPHLLPQGHVPCADCARVQPIESMMEDWLPHAIYFGHGLKKQTRIWQTYTCSGLCSGIKDRVWGPPV